MWKEEKYLLHQSIAVYTGQQSVLKVLCVTNYKLNSQMYVPCVCLFQAFFYFSLFHFVPCLCCDMMLVETCTNKSPVELLCDLWHPLTSVWPSHQYQLWKLTTFLLLVIESSGLFNCKVFKKLLLFFGASCQFPEGLSATFPFFSLMNIVNKLNGLA